LAAIWRGDARDAHAEGVVIGMVALGLLAIGRADTAKETDAAARDIWHGRHAARRNAAG
jgi:hypothetical protein